MNNLLKFYKEFKLLYEIRIILESAHQLMQVWKNIIFCHDPGRYRDLFATCVLHCDLGANLRWQLLLAIAPLEHQGVIGPLILSILLLLKLLG